MQSPGYAVAALRGISKRYGKVAALAQRVIVLGHGRVLSEGSVDDLRCRVAQTRIRCRSGLDPAVIASWPHVTSAAHEAGHLVVATAQVEAVLRRLLGADPTLAGFAVAFFALALRRLRRRG